MAAASARKWNTYADFQNQFSDPNKFFFKDPPKIDDSFVDICAFLGLKILKIGNPGTRVLRLKNLTH